MKSPRLPLADGAVLFQKGDDELTVVLIFLTYEPNAKNII